MARLAELRLFACFGGEPAAALFGFVWKPLLHCAGGREMGKCCPDL
jgi:hypothetical protein